MIRKASSSVISPARKRHLASDAAFCHLSVMELRPFHRRSITDVLSCMSLLEFIMKGGRSCVENGRHGSGETMVQPTSDASAASDAGIGPVVFAFLATLPPGSGVNGEAERTLDPCVKPLWPLCPILRLGLGTLPQRKAVWAGVGRCGGLRDSTETKPCGYQVRT